MINKKVKKRSRRNDTKCLAEGKLRVGEMRPDKSKGNKV